MDNRNKATESLEAMDAEELHSWIEAAIEAAPAQATFDKKRKLQIKEHLVAEARKKQKKADERYRRQQEWLQKMAAIQVVSKVEELSELSLKELRAQMQQWKSASATYTGLAGERWKELLKSFKLGTPPAQKYVEDHRREKLRYRTALECFLRHKDNVSFTPPLDSFHDVEEPRKSTGH